MLVVSRHSSFANAFKCLCYNRRVNREGIKELLEGVRAGRIGVDEAANKMSSMPYEDISFARVDHHRDLRLGFPEVILGQGKTPEQIVKIAERILTSSSNLLISRTDETVFARLKELASDADFHAEARMISIRRDKSER